MKRTVAPTVNAAQGRRGCRAATQHVDSVWHRRRPVLECDVHSSVVILILHHQRAAIASKQRTEDGTVCPVVYRKVQRKAAMIVLDGSSNRRRVEQGVQSCF